jgi:hypothetical protein
LLKTRNHKLKKSILALDNSVEGDHWEIKSECSNYTDDSDLEEEKESSDLGVIEEEQDESDSEFSEPEEEKRALEQADDLSVHNELSFLQKLINDAEELKTEASPFRPDHPKTQGITHYESKNNQLLPSL